MYIFVYYDITSGDTIYEPMITEWNEMFKCNTNRRQFSVECVLDLQTALNSFRGSLNRDDSHLVTTNHSYDYRNVDESLLADGFERLAMFASNYLDLYRMRMKDVCLSQTKLEEKKNDKKKREKFKICFVCCVYSLSVLM